MRATFHPSQSVSAYLSRAIEGWSGKEIRMRAIRFLLAFLLLAIPAVSFGQIGIRVAIGPPALPVYEQPICPGDGYLWTPGYWAYDDSVSAYYWVPGTWVQAPEVGFLWTPGYWKWGEGGYFFNEGYWGETVGFYGGINYGFGYWGGDYEGGRWDHGYFFYNTSVNNLRGGDFRNVYNERVENNNENRVSFNGGRGGLEARPTRQQEAAAIQRHIPAVAAQIDHAQTARANPEQRAGVNHGNPAIAATARPGAFNEEHAVAPAREAAEPSRAGSSDAPADNRNAVHPKDLAPIARPAPVNSGNAKADRKYDQKQDQLIARQTRERQNLQQNQDAEHQSED
jgi:WXXGXW repeat (2 copies)